MELLHDLVLHPTTKYTCVISTKFTISLSTDPQLDWSAERSAAYWPGLIFLRCLQPQRRSQIVIDKHAKRRGFSIFENSLGSLRAAARG